MNVLLKLFVYLQTIPTRAKQAAGVFALMLASNAVMAQQLSTFAAVWRSEAAAIVPVILLVIAGIGVCIAAWGVISGVLTKKQNQPLTWQVAAVIGGGLAVVIPIIILAVSGSLTGGAGNAGGTMNSLGI